VPSEKPATNNASVLTIDDSVRIADTQVSWRSSPEGIYNLIKLRADYDFIEKKYYTLSEFHDKASQLDSRFVNAIVIENPGLASVNFRGKSNKALNEITNIMKDRLDIYSREMYEYTCSVTRKADSLRVGDIVAITDARVPNHLTGDIGITHHLGRVMRVEFDELQGEGEITVRFAYEYDDTVLVAAAYNLWTMPTFAPTALVKQWLSADSAEVSTISYAPRFTAGQMAEIVNTKTGETNVASVTSMNVITGVVVFDKPMNSMKNRPASDEQVMSYPTTTEIHASSAVKSELASGVLSGGYKMP
jgi:hypothetical protein